MSDELQNWRKKIDAIDAQILENLVARNLISQKVAAEKCKKNLPVFDQNREKQIFENLKRRAEKLKLSPKAIDEIFRIILRESREVQKRRLAEN